MAHNVEGRRALRKFSTLYKTIAILLLNALCLVVLLNVAAWLLRWRKTTHWSGFAPKTSYFDKTGAPINDGRVLDDMVKWFDYSAMKEVPEKEAFEQVVEFSRFSLAGARYVPWAQFAEPEFHGRFINTRTNALGFPFRVSTNPPGIEKKKPRAIWVFGGSTTFGYQSSDAGAWPSRLSELLNKSASASSCGENGAYEVTNFGHLFYYSSQEAALAVHMLKTSPRPYAIVFMDGVNEGQSIDDDQPFWSQPAMRAFHLLQDDTWMGDKDRLGLFVSNFSLAKLMFPSTDPALAKRPSIPTDRLKEDGRKMFERYLFNVGLTREAARMSGTKAFFFVQPDAVYNYPVTLYRTNPPPGFFEEKVRHQVFHERVRDQKGIHYLGDLFSQWGRDRKAIVDQCHYSPSFNDFVARRVADLILASSPCGIKD